MKKRLVVFGIFFFLLVTGVFSIPRGPYSPPCDSTYGGVMICNTCHDCGASDYVCPNDYAQDTSTATSARKAMTICGGSGPSSQQETMNCNECLTTAIKNAFCTYPPSAGWCRFCFNNNCPNPTLKQASVTGTISYQYSLYSDPDCCIQSGSSSTCSQDSDCCSGHCSKTNPKTGEVYSEGHCCGNGWWWNPTVFTSNKCKEAASCSISIGNPPFDPASVRGELPNKQACCSIDLGDPTNTWQNIVIW